MLIQTTFTCDPGPDYDGSSEITAEILIGAENTIDFYVKKREHNYWVTLGTYVQLLNSKLGKSYPIPVSFWTTGQPPAGRPYFSFAHLKYVNVPEVADLECRLIELGAGLVYASSVLDSDGNLIPPFVEYQAYIFASPYSYSGYIAFQVFAPII